MNQNPSVANPGIETPIRLSRRIYVNEIFSPQVTAEMIVMNIRLYRPLPHPPMGLLPKN